MKVSRLNVKSWQWVVILLVARCGEGLSAPNLLINSSFEEDSDLGGPATGWVTPNMPDNGKNLPRASKARSGRFSHELTVPVGTTVTWYQVNQEVLGAVAGKTYTLSVHIQTDEARDGAGAYCSINCLDATDTRITWFDAGAKVQGTTTDWRRQSVTATLPQGTTKVVAILTLHGHGTAWFDDVQFEEEKIATDYHPSSVDEENLRQAERERREAREFFAATKIPASQLGLVAVFRDDLPVEGCASSPVIFAKWLSEAGYAVVYLNAQQLSNRFILRGQRGAAGRVGDYRYVDLLVLPYGASFPAAAAPAVKRYLRQDGAFFATGGYAFDAQFIAHDGKWFRPKDLPMPQTPVTSVLTFEEGGSGEWSPGNDAGGVAPKVSLVAGRAEGKALELHANPMRYWSTATVRVAERLPHDWAITRFWAKGDANTPKMAVEWTEKDGSRWKTNVSLTTEWKEFVLKLSDFWYWHDNPSVGRGGAGDRLHPENVERLLIGVAADIATPDQEHRFWIDDVCVQSDPLAALRADPICLNTRTAKIRDAMWPTPDQIPVFDPSHRLKWVRSARTSPGQFVVPASARWLGAFEGYCAVGMLGNQGHGFGPNLSRLIPLVEGLDRYGRYRGPLGSIMHTYDGYYSGASCAFFGVTNKDLFGGKFPQSQELFLSTVGNLLRRVYLHDTDTEFSACRPGETVKLRTKISNYGRQPASVQVKIEVWPPQTPQRDGAKRGESRAAFSIIRPLTLQPGTTESLSMDWKTPTSLAGLHRLRASLFLDGKPIDQEDNAVVLWGDQGDWPRTSVSKRGAYFALGDRPLFALGCQSYWGQNGSVTARSPLAFDRDFQMMQDYGLHFSRAFVPFRTDSDRRQSDAMVQLAQQHRILFYHAPNLYNTALAEELKEQAEISKALGERYRDVPWLMVDICNEPTVGTDEEKLVAAFNDFLKEKYETTERLRAAWGKDAPELGQVKLEKMSDRWDDLRSYDTHLFLCVVQQRWATSNRSAVKSSDDPRLVSVGFMQSYGDAVRVWDPLVASRDLDFTDRHYYGPFSGFPAQLKDIDMRAVGKAMIQGECGAKEHPTYEKEDPWGMGDSPERFCERFSYLVHHAFGLGATALSSWHWRDPMEGIFPCGLVHSDRVPRKAASVMRALAFTLGRLRPKYETPEVLVVVPENHRLGGSRVPVTSALHRAEELLMGCHVDFGLISEGQLDRIPAEVKALVYPVPYCPSDETVVAVKRFVEAGGALYFSGDISYDPARKLTRVQRLLDLAGVERVKELYPNIQRSSDAGIQTTQQIQGMQGGKVHPAIAVRPTTAQVLMTAEGNLPVVTVSRLGKGLAFFCADPFEVSVESQPWHRSVYLEFLRRAKITRNLVAPDDAFLRCFRVPLEDGGQAFVLHNDRKENTTATLTPGGNNQTLNLCLAPDASGLAVVDRQGRLTAVEAQGDVSRSGKPIVKVSGHVVLQSLDGEDLTKSRQLALFPFPAWGSQREKAGATASVAFRSLSNMRVELGELRQARWHRLEALKADASGRITWGEEQALNMILAAAPEQFAAAVKELEGFVAFR